MSNKSKSNNSLKVEKLGILGVKSKIYKYETNMVKLDSDVYKYWV